jgi:hypothetical protein
VRLRILANCPMTVSKGWTRGSVLLVTAHARDMGRESPFALR